MKALLVAAPARADVARVDPVFVECFRRLGIPGEQQVAVVVKVANQRGRAPGVEHSLLDVGHGRRGFGGIDGDPDHLGAGLR